MLALKPRRVSNPERPNSKLVKVKLRHYVTLKPEPDSETKSIPEL